MGRRMSTGLNNTFNEILAKDGNVFFVDRLWIKSLAEDQWAKTLELHRSFKLTSDEQTNNFFRIDIKQLTSEGFIQYFLDKSDESNSVNTLDHFVLIDIFSKMKPGVVVFYRTHLISPDLLRILSKLISHLKQNNSEWKFVLYGKANKLSQIARDRLFIEYYYPEEQKPTLQVGNNITSDSEQKDASVKRFGFVKGLFVILGLVLVGGLVYLAGEWQSSILDNQRTINSVTVDDNQDKKSEASQWQGNFQSNQTLEEMIRESKLQELEFEKRLAEINAAIPSETEVKEEEPQKDLEKNKVEVEVAKTTHSESKKESSTVNKIRLLSSDLEQAILDNDLEFLKSFNDKQMFTYGRNSAGETPLIISVNNGRENIFSWLLQQNVSVDSRDSYGRTALFYAAVQGNENFIQQLIQVGAQVSLSSSLSKTPLMAAVHNNHYDSARLLLATGNAKINTQDHSGWSALFYAVWNSSSQIASLLLEFGADINLVDSRGLSVDQVAGAAGFDEWQNNIKNQ